MPVINILFWNIQNFGTQPTYRPAYQPLAGFIAAVANLAQADVICVQELKQGAINNQYVQMVQQALCALPAPRNNWYYDWIKGAVSTSPGIVPPYATANDTDWDAAHYEGYVVFWNQNIAKFQVQPADPVPIPGGGAAPNTQSQTTRTFGVLLFGGAVVPAFGISVPAGGLAAPANPAFILPAGTTAPANAGIPGILAAGAVLGAATPVNGGTMLPQGLLIGAGGVQLNAQYLNVNPIVIPGTFTLTEPLTLPAAGSVVAPEHVLNLVLWGRDTTAGGPNPSAFVGDISGITANFNPGGPNNWQYLYFTRGAGQPASMRGSRRPAYITIDVNRNPAVVAAQRLVPIMVYHAPSAAPASSSGMQRGAYSLPMYQAYDPVAGNLVDNTFSVLGGDMNVVTDGVAYAYNAFFNGFGAGGASSVARVYNPAPPPPPANQTRADNVLNKSTAQVLNPPVGGAPIFNAATNAYRLLAIDNVFYRGFGGGTAPAPAPADLYDFLAAATGAAPPGFNIPPLAINAFVNLPLFNQILAIAFGMMMGPVPNTPGVNNSFSLVNDMWNGLFAGLAAGNDTPARRAAEFIHFCVSDHLPAVFTMNL